MLTKLHLSTAAKIGAAGLLIAAASGIGGGLASVISPAKLQNASASIDRIGEESQVIRTTFVINHSGKGIDWQLADPSHNMVQVVAGAAASAFGQLYPLIAPFLGLLGGFISGSETSAIAMLTALHLSTAAKIGAAGLLIAAASGIGGGLASVISPAKLQNASASIDRIGEESQVIRTTFVVSLVITAVCAVMALLWAF